MCRKRDLQKSTFCVVDMRILLIKAWLSEDWIAIKRVTKPNYAVHCSSLEFKINLDRVQTTAILPMTLHTVDAQKKRNGGSSWSPNFCAKTAASWSETMEDDTDGVRSVGRFLLLGWCTEGWSKQVQPEKQDSFVKVTAEDLFSQKYCAWMSNDNTLRASGG